MKKILLLIFISLLISCNGFVYLEKNENTISILSSDENYMSIKHQAYMGGSIIYNSFDVTQGHLQKGVKIYIRLGKVIDTVDGFSDVESESIYGFINVNNISDDFLQFTFTQVNQNNSSINEEYRILLGDTIDLNNDNVPDLIYEIPRRKRTGLENCRYLTFLSSQEFKKTAMFCVQPSQYNNNEYPNGIMGINPNGKIVATKYNLSDSSRSVVIGLQYGDYVLDKYSGNYQKIVHNFSENRAIFEDDVIDLQTNTNYFEEADFISKKQVDELVQRLLSSGLLNEIENTDKISILNNVLQDDKLIEKAYHLNLIYDVEDSVLEEAFTEISNLDIDTLVYMNRSFLSYLFPEYSLEKNYTSVAEIFPLLICNIGGNEIYEENDCLENRSVMASSFDEYVNKRNEINKEYKKYFNLPFGLDKYTVISKTRSKDKSNLIDYDCKIGIQGKLENEWGKKLGVKIAAVVYATMETELRIDKKIADESLIGGAKNLVKLSLPINLGVFYLAIDFPLTFDLRFSVNSSISYPLPIFGGITGLFGAETGGGIEYSVVWKKILFISLPVSLHIDKNYVSKNLICNVATYIGVASNEVEDLLMPEKASISFSLSPQFGFGAYFSALDCVAVGVNGKMGVEGRFTVSSLNNPIQLVKENKLPITSSVGVYLIPFVLNGNVNLHLPSVLDALFHVGKSEDFPISEGKTSVKIWEKKLF